MIFCKDVLCFTTNLETTKYPNLIDYIMTIQRAKSSVYLFIKTGKFMKHVILYAAAILLFTGCVNGQPGKRTEFASLPKPAVGEAVATFGGGCFWSINEAASELKGVNRVISGYAGGNTPNPTYSD